METARSNVYEFPEKRLLRYHWIWHEIGTMKARKSTLRRLDVNPPQLSNDYNETKQHAFVGYFYS